MSQHETPQGVEPDARTSAEPDTEAGSLADDLDDFEAEVPAEHASSPSQDDWPEGEPGDDPDEARVTSEDPVGPAVGERFADLHAERPWLLPGIAVGAALAIVSLVVLVRRR